MNFAQPMLQIKRALRSAGDAATKGDYDEAIALLDAIREYALASQTALIAARERRDALEQGGSTRELSKAP